MPSSGPRAYQIANFAMPGVVQHGPSGKSNDRRTGLLPVAAVEVGR